MRGKKVIGCLMKACKKKHHAKGYCYNHYHAEKNAGNLPHSKCEIENCDGVSRSRNLCLKHYTRLYRYGDPDIVLKNKFQHNQKTKELNFKIDLKEKKQRYLSCKEIADLREIGICLDG